MKTDLPAVAGAEFERVVLTAERPVLVDFWKDACGPCRAMVPILEQFGEDHVDEVAVVKVNAVEEPELAERYDVSAMPTLILFRDGEAVTRIVGAKPRRLLESELAAHL